MKRCVYTVCKFRDTAGDLNLRAYTAMPDGLICRGMEETCSLRGPRVINVPICLQSNVGPTVTNAPVISAEVCGAEMHLPL